MTPLWIVTSYLLSMLSESGIRVHQGLHTSLGGKEKMFCGSKFSRVTVAYRSSWMRDPQL